MPRDDQIKNDTKPIKFIGSEAYTFSSIQNELNDSKETKNNDF